MGNVGHHYKFALSTEMLEGFKFETETGSVEFVYNALTLTDQSKASY